MTVQTRNDVAALVGAITRRVGAPRYKLWFDKNARFRVEGNGLDSTPPIFASAPSVWLPATGW